MGTSYNFRFFRYLSALNISEKINGSTKSKENEIRTRSRAEEKRERLKIVDNITRVIDDVALNYSAEHEGKELPSSNAETKRNSTPWPENEISVKSFAKISSTTNQSHQRARKSFPTPISSKPNIDKSPVTGGNVNQDDFSITVSSPNLSKELYLISNPISGNNDQTDKNSIYTTQITTTASLSTSLRSISHISTSLLESNSTTVFTGGNQTATVSSLPSCSLHTKPHESISSGTMPHVILFPTSTINYGSPIVSPVLGMVSKLIQQL